MLSFAKLEEILESASHGSWQAKLYLAQLYCNVSPMPHVWLGEWPKDRDYLGRDSLRDTYTETLGWLEEIRKTNWYMGFELLKLYVAGCFYDDGEIDICWEKSEKEKERDKNLAFELVRRCSKKKKLICYWRQRYTIC